MAARNDTVLHHHQSPAFRPGDRWPHYGYAGQTKLDEVVGGAPYGATTITGGDGSRQPSEVELEGARYQGRQVAEVAKKLFG